MHLKQALMLDKDPSKNQQRRHRKQQQQQKPQQQQKQQFLHMSPRAVVSSTNMLPACSSSTTAAAAFVTGKDVLEQKLVRIRRTIAYTRHQSHRRKGGGHTCFASCSLARLYYQMGLIHFQLCRYTTALNVLQHGLETLIQSPETGSSTISSSSHDNYLPTLEEAIPRMSSSSLLLAATVITAQAKIHLAKGLTDVSKRTSEQLLQWLGGERVRRGIDSGRGPVQSIPPERQQQASCRVMMSMNWSLVMSRIKVILGQIYQQQGHPDIAMRLFQEALMTQRWILGDHHVQVADTVQRIGDLHTSQGFLSHAAACYNEALRVYYRQLPSSNPSNVDTTSFMVDIASTTASLGWIFLIQRNFLQAWQVTHHALGLTIQSLGPVHRNVAALQYQLGWIICCRSETGETQAPHEPHRRALSLWKKALMQQERLLLSSSAISSVRSCPFQSTSAGVQTGHHADVAKTLHSMGLAYLTSGREDKARTMFQAAAEIFQDQSITP
jgi:tetratricopeptide (TPR) repeat protein